MKTQPKKKTYSFLGYLIFFFTIAVLVTTAVAIFVVVNRESDGNTTLIAVTMFFAIVFLSLLCTLIDVLRRKIMIDAPVRKILEATERIAAGDFSVRLESDHSYEKYDDYDLIMENLNIMAAELKKSEILKSDFVSNVSHELKTPLSIIQSYATLLNKEGLDEQSRKKYAQTVLGATKRLSDLVTNILKLNKLENQQLSPETEEIRLDEMLAQTVLGFEDLIEAKSLELDCDFDEITLVSCPSYLEIVWNNLVSNAIKFTERGGKLRVSVKKENGNAVVKVSDTGCGISPETGRRIFDKFYQGDTSHSSEGNGLGLALVKKVIDVLGGEISVSSELGKGSTFTIVLKGG
ncbi:MAG: HAMP domain-containing histidine kinase [Clostridia bacterium]|nr:HAMP domain-containing histidine kinase [Clostridia bacterium]